jgi:hypothetical protein
MGMCSHEVKTVSITFAYPATSCSSRLAKVLISRLDNRRSTSLSDSLLRSIRVDEPILSMVATFRSAESRSGASVPNALHAPLNSSIWLMSLRISGVICMVLVFNMIFPTPKYTPDYTRMNWSILYYLFLANARQRFDYMRIKWVNSLSSISYVF